MTLYELTSQYTDLIRAYESAEDDAERAEILSRLDQTDESISDKAEAYARIMRNADADAKAISDEIKRLQERKKSCEALSTRMKEGIHCAMNLAGASELMTTIGKWRIQKNPWSVSILDESAIPEKYLIPQPPTVDKRAMLSDFKETGELLDGVEFTQTEGVRFR